jgi:hypothetical protein
MRRVALVAVAVVAVGLLTGCDDINTVVRPGEPLVLTGAELPDLVGVSPSRIVAFAHGRPNETPTWKQIPVQVDQRKVADFGSAPASNAQVGVTGTVYGTSPIGVTALQYADSNTFVGADPDPAFDADDELVFMVLDGGGKPRENEESEPAGVVPGSGVRVQFDDPLGEDDQGWVFLFESLGSLDPSAGHDYVDYNFNLGSGAYKTTYKRADGPNPETSSVTTTNYTIGFGDRWIETTWRMHAGSATGVDILDGNKNQFTIDSCGRSNVTFADAEGAFVANVDGPVRAIRSYIGANSGPLTQRTHLLYRDREDIVTDLRVHAIPSVMDFIDYSTAATGMIYRSSVRTGGVTINGASDAIGTTMPTWEAVSGRQGLVTTVLEVETSLFPDLDAAVDWFYRDQTSPPEMQCWGDGSLLGASGSSVVQPIANTDPRTPPFGTLSVNRHVRFAAPPSSPGAVAPAAAAWQSTFTTPLAVTVTPYDLPAS